MSCTGSACNRRLCPLLRLTTFRPWEQKLLLRRFAGGYLSGAEKQTWSRDDHEFCILCGQRDTKAHRIFHCPALAGVRHEHQDTLQEVLADCPFWAHMTFASLPQQAEVLQLLLQALRLPALGPPAPPGEHLVLFTDGSARHCQIPLARLAT